MSIITNTSSQLKVTLPLQLQQFVQGRADAYGLTMSGYIKYLVLDDMKSSTSQVFPMSEKTEKIGLNALSDHKLGKTKKIDNIDDFVDSL